MKPGLTTTILGKTHRLLGRSDGVALAALKLRNQLGAVVASRLTASVAMSENGEQDVVESFAPVCGTFVDVGAYYGTWSALFLAANPEARGILIEPEPGKVEGNLRREHLDRVHVVTAAAGAASGTASLYTNAAKCASLLQEPDRTATSDVPVVTVTEVASQHGFETVDFLKIDVEGLDFEVILGTEPLIAEGRVGVIQFEYQAMWALAGHTLTYARAWLEARGFRIFVAAPGGLRTPRWDRYGEFTWYANVVAVSDRMSAVADSIDQGSI